MGGIPYAVNYGLYKNYIEQVNHGRSMVRALETQKFYEENNDELNEVLKKSETLRRNNTKRNTRDPDQF